MDSVDSPPKPSGTLAPQGTSKRSKGRRPRSQVLVRVQPKGAEPAAFCVTSGYGDVLALASLGHKLGPNRPFYALQPPTDEPLVDASHAAARTALVERYVDEIRRVQPTGPYRLLGYSLGALFAVATTAALESAGVAVERLVLLDPPGSLPDYEYRLYRRLQSLVQRHHPRPAAALPRTLKLAHAYFTDEGFAAHAFAACDYVPEPVRAPLTIVYARKSLLRLSLRRQRWERHAGGRATVLHIDGGHFGFIRAPLDDALAQVLRDVLA